MVGIGWGIMGIALFSVLAGGMPVQAADALPKPIEPAELQRTLEQGGAIPVLVNTMSYLECWDHSIPGSICLPCEEFSQKAPNLFPDKGTPFVFYCESDQCYRSCEAATEALRMGYIRVSILRGGTPAWKGAGFSTVSRERIPRAPVESVKPEMLSRWLQEKRDLLILDVRREQRFEGGHIPGAVNIPLYRLHERYAEIPLNRPVLVVDSQGFRSFLAASYLVRKGVGDVKRLFGGMAKWQAFTAREKGKK